MNSVFRFFLNLGPGCPLASWLTVGSVFKMFPFLLGQKVIALMHVTKEVFNNKSVFFPLYSFRENHYSYSIWENTFKCVFRLEIIIFYELVWIVWMGEYFKFTDKYQISMDLRKLPCINMFYFYSKCHSFYVWFLHHILKFIYI